MPRALMLLLPLLICVPLAAVENLPADHTMERPAETEGAWENQADQIQTTAGQPTITGAYVWRGRADRNYRPFHQWELQFTGNGDERRNFQVRITPLGPDLQPLLNLVGPWQRLGDLSANGSVDTSYKLNCSIPAAYRLETKWRGGEGSMLAPDVFQLPLDEANRESQAVLMVIQPDWETRRRRTAVTFFLRNDGGAAAEEVVHTLRFRDGDGNVVHEHEYIPEDGTIPPGYAEQQQLIVEGVPKFHTILIATRKREQASLDPGAFTDAPEVQVAGVAIGDGQFTATVRNNLPADVVGLVITLDLTNANGGVLGSVDVEIGDLASGTDAPLAADISHLDGVAGYGLGMSFGEAGGGGPADDGSAAVADGAISLPPIDGVVVSVDSVTAIEGGLSLVTAISNQRDADLAGLVVTLTVTGPEGPVEVELNIGDLPVETPFRAAVTVQGVSAVTGLSMAWRAGG